MHVIGEDKSERLDKVPASLRVIVTRRPKYGCNCEEAVVQAPAPPRLIEGGIPTETLVADVVISKYADHLPLYRQAQIFNRQGIRLDRSTLAAWVGAAASELEPLHDRLLAIMKGKDKLFADETRCPVLDPGRGKTKPGFFGRWPAMIGPGTMPRHLPSSIPMRQDAAANMRRHCWKASAASSRLMAITAITSSPVPVARAGQ